MPTRDYGLFLPAQSKYKPRNYSESMTALAQQKASYESEMDQFYTKLGASLGMFEKELQEDKRQFDETLGYKEDTLAEEGRQFDVTAELEERNLDIDEMLSQAQAEYYGAQADALDQDWGEILEGYGQGLLGQLTTQGGIRGVDWLLNKVGLEDPKIKLLKQIFGGDGSQDGDAGNQDSQPSSSDSTSIFDNYKKGKKLFDIGTDMFDYLNNDSLIDQLGLSSESFGANIFDDWDSSLSNYESTLDTFSWLDDTSGDFFDTYDFFDTDYGTLLDSDFDFDSWRGFL